MSPLTFAAVALLMLSLGAHVLAPLRAGRQDAETARDVWGLAAAPLLLLALLLELLRLSAHPDLLLTVGWGESALVARTTRALGVLLLTLLAVDLVTLVGRKKMEPVGFRVAGIFAWLPLAAALGAEEILARGDTALLGPGLVLAALSRVLVALGAAEALAPAPASGRPFWTVPAALGLVAWPLLAPGELFGRLLGSGLLVPLGAAAVLFLIARWLPVRLRRPTILAATLLASLPLAWAGTPVAEPEALVLEPQTLPAP